MIDEREVMSGGQQAGRGQLPKYEMKGRGGLIDSGYSADSRFREKEGWMLQYRVRSAIVRE